MIDCDPVHPEDDDAKLREALRAVAGTLTPEEAERRIQDIYCWREEGSRPMHMITPSRAWDDPVWAMLTPERIAAAIRAIFGAPNTETDQRVAGAKQENQE